MLFIPPGGTGAIETNVTVAAVDLGTVVTAGGVAHTKNTTYATLIAATAYDAYGITIQLSGTGTTASTNYRMLVDIAIGEAASETVIIPNLMCGNVPQFGGALANANMYYFPIFIPKGVRLSATAQALVVSDTCGCTVWLHQFPGSRDRWIGSRVMAYGASTATSSGVSHSPGNAAWAAATEIIASCTYPVRAMQFGYDLLTGTTGANSGGLLRIGIGATPTYVATGLPFNESTTLETVSNKYGNFILSHMRFNIPAATRLAISAQRNVAAAARGWILYGVD